MSEVLSWRERIVVRVAETLAAMQDIACVKRNDARDEPLRWEPETGRFQAMLLEGEESVTRQHQAYTDKTLTLAVVVLVGQQQQCAENLSFLHNRWMAKLEKALLADTYWIEPSPSSVQLATDTRLSRVAEPAVDENGGIYAAVLLEIDYRHDEGDPYARAGTSRSYDVLPDACLWHSEGA